MTMSRLCATLLASAVVLFCQVEQARALKEIDFVDPVFAYVGLTTIGGVTRPTLVTKYNNVCTRHYLSSTSVLTDDVRIVGSNYGDTIFFTFNTVSWCGLNIAPFYGFNGYSIRVEGSLGNDLLTGGPGVVYSIDGGWDDDYIQLGSYGAASGNGSYENDVVLARGVAGQYIYGGWGNDHLCAYQTNANAQIYVMMGGEGTDTRCGTGSYVTSAESVDCSASICAGLPF